jgi:sortase A
MPDITLTPGSSELRPRPRLARSLRVLSVLLISLGVLALADAAVTLLWQEPFSALYAQLQQDRLSGALRGVERALPTQDERRALASLPDERRRISFLARRLERDSAEGAPVGRIAIPSIGASFVMVDGTDTAALEEGPGIYSRSSFAQASFPGLAGTTAIAGHRTTYLAPFRRIDELRGGEHVVLEMPYARFTYTVTGQRVVLPTDVAAAVDDVGYPRLVLSACTPLFSAAERILVFARLSSTVPLGAARTLPKHALARPIPGWRAGSLGRAKPHSAGLPAVLEAPQLHGSPPAV